MDELARWEGRFGVPEYIFGTAPNAFLAAHRHLLPQRGRALAIADGEGRNGVWLAQQGSMSCRLISRRAHRPRRGRSRWHRA